MAIVRYVIQNPIHSGFCVNVEDWKWSSYSATSGFTPCPGFLSTDFILGLFSGDGNTARGAYMRYVSAACDTEPWMKFERTEPVVKKEGYLISLNAIFSSCRDMGMRNKAIVDAYNIHGYTMIEIANYLGISKSRVSQVVKMSTENLAL